MKLNKLNKMNEVMTEVSTKVKIATRKELLSHFDAMGVSKKDWEPMFKLPRIDGAVVKWGTYDTTKLVKLVRANISMKHENSSKKVVLKNKGGVLDADHGSCEDIYITHATEDDIADEMGLMGTYIERPTLIEDYDS